ncbi:PIN domain-containing protein [Oleomonas cavernae]|uniref:PIN domain-containing protein n=1 Tax=Oleomonas cavernae TaxID=2320859 RepID=A0A418WTG4_9PROT|nr:PIN domain-containing protein [Oleomonas cavernae]RJF94562.1 PIN domain-containing protein [Oleomonas cavernae]
MTRIAFDTNIFVYAIDTTQGDKHHVAIDLLARAARTDAIILRQCMAEFANVSLGKGGQPPAKVRQWIEDWLASFPIARDDGETVLLALTLKERYRLAWWDALLLAAATEAEVDLLVTEDLQDSQILGTVLIANPFLPAGRAAIDAALTQA